MIWYKLFIRYSLSGLCERYVQVENHWDLFAYIGYIECTSLENIERIDYKIVLENEIDSKDKIISSHIKYKYQKED